MLLAIKTQQANENPDMIMTNFVPYISQLENFRFAESSIILDSDLYPVTESPSQILRIG